MAALTIAATMPELTAQSACGLDGNVIASPSPASSSASSERCCISSGSNLSAHLSAPSSIGRAAAVTGGRVSLAVRRRAVWCRTADGPGLLFGGDRNRRPSICAIALATRRLYRLLPKPARKALSRGDDREAGDAARHPLPPIFFYGFMIGSGLAPFRWSCDSPHHTGIGANDYLTKALIISSPPAALAALRGHPGRLPDRRGGSFAGYSWNCTRELAMFMLVWCSCSTDRGHPGVAER